MAITTLILGESGTGKSYSMHNLDPETTLLVQTLSKPLPFRPKGWQMFDSTSKKGSIVVTDNWAAMVAIQMAESFGKNKVIFDDIQYLMANEFMRRHAEKGYSKFTEIAHHIWSVIIEAQSIANNVRYYFLSHTEKNDQGDIKCKTIGKMLDDKITLEGMFTIVLRSLVTDQGYYFSTQNNGSDTVKSPVGLFEDIRIDNDLAMIDNAITEYYDITTLTAGAK